MIPILVAALESKETRNFVFSLIQQFRVLIRDWQFPDEHDYGMLGGKEFIQKRLKVCL